MVPRYVSMPLVDLGTQKNVDERPEIAANGRTWLTCDTWEPVHIMIQAGYYPGNIALELRLTTA